MFFSFKKAPKAWTEDETQELIRRFRSGYTIKDLSRYFSRSNKDVHSKLESLFRKMLQTQELYLVAKKLDVPYTWISTLIHSKK